MESSQPKYIRKIKLRLKQPAIKCSGRRDVACHYHGKVLCEHAGYKQIMIKTHGREQIVTFMGHECTTPGFEDLKEV